MGWATVDDGSETPGSTPSSSTNASEPTAPSPDRPEARTRPDVTRDLPPDRRATALEHQDVQARVEAAVAATEAGPVAAPGADPMLGRTIGGRFEILSRIGAGGMGIVYKARQVGIDRIVAVKMLLKELAHDEKVIKRFKVEALAVSRLNHPNTIRIFDFGQADDGTLYFAMEYLDGSSLEEALRKEGTFPARRTLHVLRQIAASLIEAHEKGIVHRDLKPDNVYLTKVGEDADFVKVLDFGVAKLREADKRQGTVTQAGTIFGTPRYMAPEQCRSMAVDQRADLYALGIIAYEMLVGHAPFDAENPLAILIQHVQEPPRPMAEARPDIEVPEEVEALVRKCLEKSPEHRFQHASDLVSAVAEAEAHLVGRFERVVYVHGPRPEPAPRPAPEASTVASLFPAPPRRRRPFFWTIASLAVLVPTLAVGLWSTGLLGPDAAVPPPQAIPESAVVPVPVGIPALVPPAPSTVSIRFASDPGGAEVVLRGRVLGSTPLTIDLPHGTQAESFAFRKNGYLETTVEAIPDRDSAVSASLKRNVLSGGRPKPSGRGIAPDPAASPAPVPAVAPAPAREEGPSKVRDLKNY